MATFDDQRKSAFDYASGAIKQVITLSTAILAVSITFATDIVENTTAYRWLLVVAWIVYIGAILFGLWCLLALTGELEEKADTSEVPSTRGGNVVLPAVLMIVTFVGATGLLVAYGGLTLDEKATPEPAKTSMIAPSLP